jgi:isopenicillin-N epimerase
MSRVSSLKELFLLDPAVAYLNHGSFGATPASVFDDYQRWQRELELEPAEFLGRRHNELMTWARAVLAAYLHTTAENVVYTQNATLSVNIVARSLRLGPGDEVLASDHEYGACDRAWRFLAQRQGFRYIRCPIRLPVASTADFLRQLWDGVTSHTRAIFLSHITSPTAVLFPVTDVCTRARAAGILTVIDGAHAPGQIPLDLSALEADFYAGNLHKWLCAPKGAGFLFARPEVQSLLDPLVISWGFEADPAGNSRFIDYFEWTGTRDIASFLAVPAAIRFQEGHHWSRVRSKCHTLLQSAIAGVTALSATEPLYMDDSWYVQMGAAELTSSVDTKSLQTRLYDEYRIEVPLLEWNDRKLIRVSVQGYNARRDVDRLLEALESLL